MIVQPCIAAGHFVSSILPPDENRPPRRYELVSGEGAVAAGVGDPGVSREESRAEIPGINEPDCNLPPPERGVARGGPPPMSVSNLAIPRWAGGGGRPPAGR